MKPNPSRRLPVIGQPPHSAIVFAVLAGVLAGLVFAGCDSDGDEAESIYSLELRTLREYRITSRTTQTTTDHPEPIVLAENEWRAELFIDHTAVHEEVEYAVEQAVQVGMPGSDVVSFERHLRRDKTGLYGSDWGLEDPSTGDERRWLAFPLRVGLEWNVVEDPPYRVAVEAKESISVPAGRFETYRVDAVNGGSTAADSYHEWYGAPGLVKSSNHWERPDPSEPGGILVSDVIWELTVYGEY